MDAYSFLARVYDLFQDNIDYGAWRDFLVKFLQEQGITEGLVLDLGCGTGTMTGLLAESGYDMIGVDHSPEMLQEAMEKSRAAGHDILYLLQDMADFELYGTVRAIVSVCDSLNYLTEEEDLLQAFRLAANYLDPGGIFLFDMNMPCRYAQIGSRTIAENREEGSFIWENDYDPQSGINEYDLTLFLPREDGLFEKTEEFHYQRAYPQERIRELLMQAGLEFLGAFDGYSDKPAGEKSERVVFAARETGGKKAPLPKTYRTQED